MQEREQTTGKAKKVFTFFFLPLLFLAIVTGVIVFVFDFTSFDYQSEEANQMEVEEVEQELQQAQNQNAELLEEFEQMDVEISVLEEEKAILNEELEAAEALVEDLLVTDEEREEQIAALSRTYTEMSASAAAERLEELTVQEASLLLGQMSADDQASILSSMNPSVAATVTTILKENQPLQDQDRAAMQERINLLVTGLEETEDEEGPSSTINVQQMVDTMKQMPRQAAAQIFVDMMNAEVEAEFQLGLIILANMSDETRAEIFTEMDAEEANAYIQSLSE